MSAPGYPVSWEADVLLRDGHPVHLRPITPGDGDALRRFHSSLSSRTVYFRFFAAKPELTDRDVEHFTHVDYQDRVALLALDTGTIIGVGRFDAIGDGSAEVAFLIRDDVQGLGLGSILLEHLAAAARERGVRRFVAEVLPANARMLATFREAGYVVEQHREEDVLAVSFELEPTAQSLSVMASREHRAEARSVQRLLQPRSVAVVGASRSPGGMGHRILSAIVEGGYAGHVVAVHPEVDAIAGVTCVRSLAQVDGQLDLVVVAVPAAAVPAVIDDASAAGVHALVIVSGGFGDAGAAGLAQQAELVAVAHRTGMRVVGPNALGLINTDPDVRLNASLVPRMPLPGRVGFFCQSGALGSAILERFEQRGLGVSTFVSAGNRADVSGNDLLQYWQEDPSTDLVLLYLESIGNARKFARLVHTVARVKPVVMVRSGGVEQAHPRGHAVARTSLTQKGVDQVLADCGLVVVNGIDDLIDVGRLAAGQPLPTGDAVAIIGNSNALAVMAANALAGTALRPAGMPVTFARQEEVASYERAVHDAMTDQDVGAVLVIYVPAVERNDDAELRRALRDCRICGATHAKPVVSVMRAAAGGVDAADAPVFVDVEDAVRALSSVAGLARWRLADRTRTAADARVDGDGEAVVARSPVGVLRGPAAARLMTSAGMVSVTVDAERDARGTPTIGCRIRLIEDPLYGPVVVVGVDDPVAELLDDRAYRLAPVTLGAAREMLVGLGAIAALGFAPPESEPAIDALSSAIADVSRLHLRVPGVTDADLRAAAMGPTGALTVGDLSVTVSESAVTVDPAARRM